MTYITYKDINFTPSTRETIERARAICEDFAARGYDLSLRQLYYQFVARAWIPNKEQSYKRLSAVISDARLAGEISWDHLVDRTRDVEGDLSGYSTTPNELIQNAARSYFEDLWADQDYRVEVWVEKDALADVVRRAVGGLRVASFANKGYVSQSAMWRAGQRIAGYFDEGKDVLILHLGDHDPSGIDMTRDIEDRLEMFAGNWVHVKRIALNMDQIRQYNPPPNPTKVTDSRAKSYIDQFGHESWELDALDPDVLVALIESEVRAVMDDGQWSASARRERGIRNEMISVASHWPEIAEQYGSSDD